MSLVRFPESGLNPHWEQSHKTVGSVAKVPECPNPKSDQWTTLSHVAAYWTVPNLLWTQALDDLIMKQPVWLLVDFHLSRAIWSSCGWSAVLLIKILLMQPCSRVKRSGERVRVYLLSQSLLQRSQCSVCVWGVCLQRLDSVFQATQLFFFVPQLILEVLYLQKEKERIILWGFQE